MAVLTEERDDLKAKLPRDGLRLCAACDGDPEAHGLHVCSAGALLDGKAEA
jgi:hypothetical protein